MNISQHDFDAACKNLATRWEVVKDNCCWCEVSVSDSVSLAN